MDYETESSDFPLVGLLGGLALGALAMYMADPDAGRQRRAFVQDKVGSARRRTSEAMSEGLHGARERIEDLQSGARRILQRAPKPLDNHVLEARVRSRVGRAMSQLRELAVQARQGLVTLAGEIADEDRGKLERLVAAIPGVESVRFAHGEGVQWRGMQALRGRNGAWLAAAIGAGALGWYALSRRTSLLGLAAAAAGMGMLSRGAPRRHGLQGSEGQAFEAEKSVLIKAAPETVFDVWSRYENFPHFMSHVVEVRDLGQNRSHWIVQGPAGRDVEWNSVLTESNRPQSIAWQSEPGADVEHHGSVRLQAAEGGTRATVRMAWNPPAGAAGQGLAVLLGVDPESVLEDDLQRMKHFIESGLPAREKGEGGAAAGTVLH